MRYPMKNILHIILLVVSLASLTSCKLFFKSPVIEKVHDIRVVSIDPDKTVLELSISVHNPNRYKLRMNKLDVDLLSKNREKIGSASLKAMVEIPKKKSNALEFRISLDTRSTIKMINHSDQKVFLYVCGKGSGKVLGSTKVFDFEEPYEVDIQEQLQKVITAFQADGKDIFLVKRSYVSKVGFTESQIRVDFIIMNPYGLEFTLSKFPSTINIENKESGTGYLERSLYFNEKIYSQEGSMIFKINNWKSIINAVKGAINGEIGYEVKGKVQVDAYGLKIERPFTYRDEIAINISELIF